MYLDTKYCLDTSKFRQSQSVIHCTERVLHYFTSSTCIACYVIYFLFPFWHDLLSRDIPSSGGKIGRGLIESMEYLIVMWCDCTYKSNQIPIMISYLVICPKYP